jgi:hypothetical protein
MIEKPILLVVGDQSGGGTGWVVRPGGLLFVRRTSRSRWAFIVPSLSFDGSVRGSAAQVVLIRFRHRNDF